MIPGSANPLLLKSAAAAAGGYQVQRSLRFNSSDSAYLSRTPAVAGNRRTWTWAAWVKCARVDNGGLNNDEVGYIFEANPTGIAEGGIRFFGREISVWNWNGSTDVYQVRTSALLRDPSAWMHIVVAIDTTQATTSNRLKIYFNGVQQTNFSTATYPSLNLDDYINSAIPHNIGRKNNGSRYLNASLADIHFIDGQALTPSSFTEVSATTGQLIPKAYSGGSYGTNGFYLQFADNSSNTAATLGKDTSGNSNNWTPNNLSVTAGAGNDSLVDTPTSYGTDTSVGGEVRGNYATLNPLAGTTFGALSDGNLKHTASGGNFSRKISTIGVASGKWYAEFTFETAGDNTNQCGVLSFVPPVDANNQNGEENGSGIYNGDNGGNDGTIIINGTKVLTGQTVSGSGTIIGVTLDADSNNVKFYRNGTIIGSSSGYTPTNVSGTWYFVSHTKDGSSANVVNFGQRAFAHPVSGFKALCDTNLGAPLVAKPNTVMDVALYTGNGSTQTISGLGFSPDFVWLRNRSQASNWVQFDTVRGVLNRLCSNLTVAEASLANSLTSFDSTGFTYGSEGSGNNNGDAFAAFCWDAGTSTVSNTAGSITSQVRANVSAGFSVVTYTGTGSTASVGHGLGVAPAFYITKRRDSSSFGNWTVYHSAVGTQALELNSTGAAFSDSTRWPSAATSTVFNIGSNGNVNTSSGTYVAYCFAPVVGYSSFGSYTGNGSASDGPFVYTGFRPKWILVKRTDSADDWPLMDTVRTPANPQNAQLWPNFSNAESSPVASSRQWDALSNGFKLRGDNGAINASAGTYIYIAFAENPFQYARAR